LPVFGRGVGVGVGGRGVGVAGSVGVGVGGSGGIVWFNSTFPPAAHTDERSTHNVAANKITASNTQFRRNVRTITKSLCPPLIDRISFFCRTR
jgi:hypothetical protein